MIISLKADCFGMAQQPKATGSEGAEKQIAESYLTVWSVSDLAFALRFGTAAVGALVHVVHAKASEPVNGRSGLQHDAPAATDIKCSAA